MTFKQILKKYRDASFSERDKGDRFERLIQGYLKTDPMYANKFKEVWLWSEFPYKHELGSQDTGIDLVAQEDTGEYWAIQCKFYDESSPISKKDVDTFLSTSSRSFQDGQSFSNRLFISTTNKWSSNAEDSIKNQTPPVVRLGLNDLKESPVKWDKLEEGLTGQLARDTQRELRDHQKDALSNTHEHFKEANRGKLIMACGTGKTFTSLRIAENEAGNDGLVLFLVPSIALLGQTLREWLAFAKEPIKPICICSDSQITKEKKYNDDVDTTSVIDLALPASTNVKNIVKQFRKHHDDKTKGMTVVFSTYQSIDVIAEAQKVIDKDIQNVFDLIICDEAHRTTGVSLSKEDESAFTKVHDNNILEAKKRLYMTATPRLYSDKSKSKAAQNEALIASMDDESLYGKEVYRIGFGEAVEKDLLTDYKVIILTLNDKDIPLSLQKSITQGHSIETDDVSRLVGCINAFSKQIHGDEDFIKVSDPSTMQRAVAFCQNINVSKNITNAFNDISDEYIETKPVSERKDLVSVESQHIDGAMSALERDGLLSWLKEEHDSTECRVLTNVRCLSEGVDVPSLDAVLFLSARNSQVDVVQSVGRVMRKAEGKKYGYIVIPVVVPSDADAKEALDSDDRFKVVWTVLNALRAHDDRFNATINKIDLNKKKPDNILVGGMTSDEEGEGSDRSKIREQLRIQFEELQEAVFAKMVLKVGDRVYWEKWAKDVAQIATRQIERINYLIEADAKHQEAFGKFLAGLQANINPSITKDQAVEMLSQHVITKPIFEALFENYSFVQNNPVSTAMQNMLDILEEEQNDADFETLQNFYDSVKRRVDGIDNAEGKQKIIVELYDKFFKTAFPKMVEQLGIVYTPVEVVDFIIHSVNDVLKKEFNRTLADENTHILDPFTGTGTFITRLIQSGLIDKEKLLHKYQSELHANEIVLLAYYIATVNIENALHDQLDDDTYHPFEGIVLTDTFQLSENTQGQKVFSEMFPVNSERAQKQQNAPIKVIMGNPPYSAGQKSRDDNAQNQKYEKLELRIKNTYGQNTDSKNINKLYDSYIKAFRWSTDRLGNEGGVVAFVSNGAWLDGNNTDGFRKVLEEEFSSIYVFNLRGNQRTSGELSRKEGGKIFGSGSRTPISITLLIKKPKHTGKATIYYHDIGDYLNRDEKLKIIKEFGSVGGMEFKTIESNEHGDWISQRSDIFDTYINIENNDNQGIMNVKSIGIQFKTEHMLKSSCKDFKNNENNINTVVYRPFYKQLFSNTKESIYRPGKWNVIATNFNHVICVSGKSSSADFSCLMTGSFADYQLQKNGQCFPLYYYEELDSKNQSLFDGTEDDKQYVRKDGVGDFILDRAKKLYGKDVSKEDIFYYVYGLLHSPEYREAFAKDLKKMLPRLPLVESIPDFWAFSKAGRALAELHINYESVEPYSGVVVSGDESGHYRVEKLKYAKTKKEVDGKLKNVDDPSAIIYNSKITLSNIPLKAYEYVVNGKPAIGWILDRYQVKTDKKSGITNDPNDWAEEIGNPRYILDLLLSVINVSVQTVEIIERLPKLQFKGNKNETE
jgi:predicted helicase